MTIKRAARLATLMVALFLGYSTKADASSGCDTPSASCWYSEPYALVLCGGGGDPGAECDSACSSNFQTWCAWWQCDTYGTEITYYCEIFLD